MSDRTLTVSLLGVFTLALAACSTPPKIQYDSVQGYDFSKARTYAIIDTKGKTSIDIGPGVAQVGYDAIDEGFQGLGLTEAPAAEADLLVLAHLEVTDKMDINTYGYGYGGYRGYGYYGGGYGVGTTTTTTRYKDTTLAIDVVDNAEDVLVWRGWASKNIYGDTKGTFTQKQRENFKTVILNILANFPPPSAGEEG
jgi:hypothetical protein